MDRNTARVADQCWKWPCSEWEEDWRLLEPLPNSTEIMGTMNGREETLVRRTTEHRAIFWCFRERHRTV